MVAKTVEAVTLQNFKEDVDNINADKREMIQKLFLQ